MIIKKKILGVIAAIIVSGYSLSALATTEVQWWHAMGGVNGERVNKIAADFNASQSDFKVIPSYKGNYTETMTAAIAAFRAKDHDGCEGCSISGRAGDERCWRAF